MPAGNLSKAAFVGAKKVNGPVPDKVSAKPAAVTAATNVVWSAEPTATSTTFCAKELKPVKSAIARIADDNFFLFS
ncbi:hypothetical protein SAMN05444395_101351 [Flavobacterium fryxellicola]|nr:hypothetical protein SAMN05444395_101351 [Flavobacterium fryxellicola]